MSKYDELTEILDKEENKLKKKKKKKVVTPKYLKPSPDALPIKNIYDDELCPKRVYKLALLGLNNTELALCFDVSPGTIKRWCEVYPNFGAALLRGRTLSSANVAKALYHRAVGFYKPVYKPMVVDKQVVSVRTLEYFPPSVDAQKYWLNNREREHWGNKTVVEHNINHSISMGSIDMSDFSDAELDVMLKLGIMVQEKEGTADVGPSADAIDAQFKEDYELPEETEVEEEDVDFADISLDGMQYCRDKEEIDDDEDAEN